MSLPYFFNKRKKEGRGGRKERWREREKEKKEKGNEKGRERESEAREGGKEERKRREEGKEGREKEKFLKLGSLCLVHNLSILFEYLLD